MKTTILLRAFLADSENGLKPTETQHVFQNLEDAQKKAKQIAEKYPEAKFKCFQITELEF